MSADSYIGKSPQYGYFEKQRITSANGVLTSFALAFTTADSSQLLVSVGGVIQEPGQSYTVDASVPQNIVFTEAPASSIEIFIIWMGKQTTGPTFGAAMLTDKTSLGTQPAAADTFLLYDDTASALKKVTYSNLIPTTHGDVSGPASSTDEALARFDLTTGKILLNSTATLTDAGTLTATAFAGPLTGNVTGNASGTAATVTGATQSNITALGTIASLVATTADINAGTFDGIVGGTTPAAGSFTTLSGSTSVSGGTITGTQVDITAQGDLRLQDTTGGEYVGFQAAGTTTTYTVTMPGATAASDGQALTITTSGTGSWSTVGDASLANANEWTAQQNFNNTALSFDATQDWALTANQVATLTLTGNTTFDAPTQMVDGSFYSLIIIQDGTGSRTASWNTVFKWAAATAPTLTTTASAKDIFVWRSDGTNMYEVGRQLNVS